MSEWQPNKLAHWWRDRAIEQGQRADRVEEIDIEYVVPPTKPDEVPKEFSARSRVDGCWSCKRTASVIAMIGHLPGCAQGPRQQKQLPPPPPEPV